MALTESEKEAQRRYRESGKSAQAAKARRTADPERFRAYARTWRENNLEKERERSRTAKLKEYHKNRQSYLDRNLEKLRHWWRERVDLFWVDQKGLCAICERPMIQGGPRVGGAATMSCDHSPKTGHPRALLCAMCNKALGGFRENPELLTKAAEYLRKWGG